MPDPLQELLAAGAVPTTSFPPTSRYAEIGVDAYAVAGSGGGKAAGARPENRVAFGAPGGDGSPPVPFLRRRFCPRPDRFALLYEFGVVEGDRRDLLGDRHAGDAELWWRLADANGAVDPRSLTETVGRRLRVTLQEGVPGSA